jgi:hypothetical protein
MAARAGAVAVAEVAAAGMAAVEVAVATLLTPVVEEVAVALPTPWLI